MRFLSKPDPSAVSPDWRYPSNARQIRQALYADQIGFCAYTEDRLERTSSWDIEHFDPRLKNTDDDGPDNWYGALHWLNMRKDKETGRKIQDLQPMLHPTDPTLQRRVHFFKGEFRARNKGDTAAHNLLRFLYVNHPDLAQQRENELQNYRQILKMLGGDLDTFREFLLSKPRKLRYVSAVEAEFDFKFTRRELAESLQKA